MMGSHRPRCQIGGRCGRHDMREMSLAATGEPYHDYDLLNAALIWASARIETDS